NNGQDLGSNGDNSDLEAVPKTSFEASNGSKKNNSDDPFNIYSILNRTHKVPNDNANVVNSGPAFPPGFTPPVDQVGVCSKGDNLNVETTGSDDVRTFGGSKVHFACSGSFKKSIAFGGSFLNVMEEVVKVGQTMGFNMEVRYKSDRFGSAFNVQDADDFNSFIVTAGLVEVPLDGVIDKYEEDLGLIDSDIDSGKGSDMLVAKRIEILNDLQNMEKLHAMDMAQKAKIKWSIEGDENSRFFHGVLNKKRNQMNIRGVMVDGAWQEKPSDVKQEFYNHFRNRFDKPSDQRATVDMLFSNSLSPKQQADLECDMTVDELKQAV
nr:RNA-directed DNA polymerase, eukaryota [Tanacetum cinerariifolium]